MLKKLFYKLIKKTPLDFEMVKYWKTQEQVAAKITKAKDGSTIMKLEGEKYPLAVYPRGYLLFGPLSKLKHEIKNQIFNESWQMLEKGVSNEEIISHIKSRLFGEIASLARLSKYDMLAPSAMTPSVREIHRAWTKVSPQTAVLRDYLCFILQEDDSYRNRVQWLVEYFNPNKWYMRLFDPVKLFEKALMMLEHAEVISDMKERIKLLRTILLLALSDESIRRQFTEFVREVDWEKVKLTRGDKYHFRAKYFKVDYKYIDY